MMLSGKVAIVTGAGGGGCGRAIACRLAREGAVVVLADLNETGLQATARAIAAQGGRALFRPADVADEAAVRSLVAFAEQTCGGPDILVNNASALVFPEKSFDDWFANLRVDLLGAMYATRYAIEAMRPRGGGAIVNIGSTSALPHGDVRAHGPSATGYNTAKAGIMRMTTTLSGLGATEGIRVNCLVPHWIGTDHIKAIVAGMTPAERREAAVPDVLLPPEELAEGVLRLATDTSLAGRILVCYGGQPPRLIPFGDPGYVSLQELGSGPHDGLRPAPGLVV
jgi:NAD(P)-dependent dehydrogenase (short-subunit alcohol dehydrogenase family)